MPLVGAEAPVTHPLDAANNLTPVWTRAPNQLLEEGSVASRNAVVVLEDEQRMLRIIGDETKYGNQIVSQPLAVKPDRDYVFRLPLKLEEGRALLKVTGQDPNVTQQQALAASVIDVAEGVAPSEQALKRIEIPSWVNTDCVVLANNASGSSACFARRARSELYPLVGSSVINGLASLVL